MDGDAKFAVIMGRHDVFVRMCRHAGIDPKQHMHFSFSLRHLRTEAFSFHDIVDDQRTDPGLQRFFDLPGRFVVSVKVDAFWVNACCQRRVQFPAADHIQREIMPLRQPHHLLDAECLGCVQHLTVKHITVKIATIIFHAFFDRKLVIYIKWGSIRGCQHIHTNAADPQDIFHRSALLTKRPVRMHAYRSRYLKTRKKIALLHFVDSLMHLLHQPTVPFRQKRQFGGFASKTDPTSADSLLLLRFRASINLYSYYTLLSFIFNYIFLIFQYCNYFHCISDRFTLE